MHIGKAPILISGFFRIDFMPDRPHEAGNPVYRSSTDIIYYGLDLEDYLENGIRRHKEGY